MAGLIPESGPGTAMTVGAARATRAKSSEAYAVGPRLRRRLTGSAHNTEPPHTQGRKNMASLTRRTMLAAGAASLGAPAILRAQPATVKLGLIQPATGPDR